MSTARQQQLDVAVDPPKEACVSVVSGMKEAVERGLSWSIFAQEYDEGMGKNLIPIIGLGHALYAPIL